MLIISHRGQLDGPCPSTANNPQQILKLLTIYPGLHFELDLWITDCGLFLGHDSPDYSVSTTILDLLSSRSIFHIKHVDSASHRSMLLLSKVCNSCHYFAHDLDSFTITSRGLIWVHPKMGVLPNTVAVMPEHTVPRSDLNRFFTDLTVSGVCTDFPLQFL
jgi:hypothetical protein